MSRRTSSPQLALSAIGLEKTYGELVALAPTNLSIADGESVALIGHNGSGKTTMIRMLAGLLEPSEGKIDIYGAPAGSERARAALSYLPDNPVLYDDLSLWEHAEYIAKLHGHTEWSDDATFLADKFGLTARVDDLPVTFSRGLRQKASLMLGLIRPFRLLVVDEPFVGLDVAGKAGLIELLETAHNDGATLLVATHELEYLKRADRVLALRDGEIIHDGPVNDVEVAKLVSADGAEPSDRYTL